MSVFGVSQFVLVPQRQWWPTGEGLVLDPAGGPPLAAVRTEPWPEVRDRPWPDGAAGRPWLMRLLGVGRDPERGRTVVRRLSDGYPLVRLHRRQPLFYRTVGIFDGDDRRVGYCRWGFKGAGSPDEFAVVRPDHSPAGGVRRAGAGEYRVTGAAGGAGARVTLSASGCHVCLPEAGTGEGPDGVLLLAAAVVLFQLAGRPDAEPAAAPARPAPGAP